MTTGINFVDPADADKYYAGQLVWVERPRWWVRLLRWMAGSLKGQALVTRVDHRAGVVEVETIYP